MNRADFVRKIEAEYAARKSESIRALSERIEEAIRIDPKIGVLMSETPRFLENNLNALLESPERAGKMASDIRKRAKNSRVEIKARLKAAGLSSDWLEMSFVCAECRDTGYVGDDIQRRCRCFEQELTKRIYADNEISRLSTENFETFDESVFPDESPGDGKANQRRRAIRARDICKQYADALPDSEKLNIMLIGSSGQGKTFLLNCVAKRAMDRNIGVLKLTAYQMFAVMRATHMDENDGRRQFEDMLDAELLLLDDIGSEPLFKNITVEYLFIMLNERTVQKRHSVIATNLSAKDLYERYGERVTSRLLSGNSEIIHLTGRDIRLKGKG
jgi:DNA replication protein DnaC